MLIGKRIKDLRIANGISQQELGDKVGVTKVSFFNVTDIVSLPLSIFNVNSLFELLIKSTIS